MDKIFQALYDEIKHGDKAHQQWLYDKMTEFFEYNVGKQLKSDMANTETVKENLQGSLTNGQKAVGITFNPGGMSEVNKIKELCAAVIDEIDEQRAKAVKDGNGEKIAQFTLAIRKIQEGQMWGVKAITWQY